MIRIVRPAVATSIQDRGRFGHRAEGFSRSGAMDPLSLALTNQAAGAPEGAAAIELGPGPAEFEATRNVAVALGGATREGATWWKRIELEAGRPIKLSAPRNGVWSYLALEGGVAAPLVLGSRSTQVREGIGNWLNGGDVIESAREPSPARAVEAPPFSNRIRIYGSMPGEWKVGARVDRMGYELDGTGREPGPPDEWSEPLLPGCIQVLPSGKPIVLMAEGPTVGGYRVTAVVHSEDLRLVAQTPTGGGLEFTSVSDSPLTPQHS